MKKGTFIVLDGNDGSGKATQTRLLVERLSAEDTAVKAIDFPTYERNFFGSFLAECLVGKHGDFVHLDPKIVSTLYAFDRFESSDEIRADLEKGVIVIADRFTSSNQIHQGGKIEDEEERIKFLSWLKQMEHEVLHIPRPDLILYLRVPVEISLKLLLDKRAAKNQLLASGVKDTVEGDRAYLERSYATANWLAAREPNWRVVDCVAGGEMRSVESIQEEVFEIVRAHLTSGASA